MAGKHGGARPGSGRPRKAPAAPVAPVVVAQAIDVPADGAGAPSEPVDMLKLLQGVALGTIVSTPLQVRAAIAAVQYTHTKRHDGGKKEEAAEKAAKVAAKFKPTAAPLKLVARG